MGDPVRFVKIRVCKNCGERLVPQNKGDLCPECRKQKEEENKSEIHDISSVNESSLP